MPDSGWSIRLYEANDYSDEATIDFLSNFKEGKSRQLDSIITYSGMYGIDNYLVWNLHKDLPNYDFSTVALDLSLYMYKSTDIVYFQDFYRVQDIKFNPSKSQYTLYAVSEPTVRLHSKLIKYGVTSLSYKKDRTAKQLLKDIIEKNNIFYVLFHDDSPSTKDMVDYQYRYFDIDPDWTVLDLIEYIANDNQYEWCVTTFVDKGTNKPYFFLHIGHELKASKHMNATKPLNIETDNKSDSVYTMKITINGSPMQPLAHWEEDYRCMWSKHTAGKGGGISRGCFAPIGMGHFDKFLYLRTLEGNIERNIGYSMLTRRKERFPSISIGNILKDEGDAQIIDGISIQKNPKTYSIREPHNILINRGDDELLVQHQLEKITRSTPYLDHEAGLLFPSSGLEEDKGPPNSIIFNVDGKRESAVAGPFIMGDGRIDRDEDGKPTGDLKFIIPFKKKGDFRLKFPDKSEFFYNSVEGFWALESPHGFVFKNSNITKHDELPANRLVEGDNTAVILKDDMFWIEGPTQLFQLEPGGCFHLFPKTDELGNLGQGRYEIHAYNDLGLIMIYGDNKIKIKTSKAGASIDIETGDGEGGFLNGTININTAGTVNIGANATNVNLAGGAKALSHADHKHLTGNMGIPIPPHIPAEGTIKTKAD